jgi:hypothetical protein
MNKLASVKLSVGQKITTRRKRQAAARVSHPTPPDICSYTNDLARAAETCQAPSAAKKPAAE